MIKARWKEHVWEQEWHLILHFIIISPVNVFAAHGYGPVLLAGAEIIQLLTNFSFYINDSSLQLKERE